MNGRERDMILARLAGYHEDRRLYDRLVEESRVRRVVLKELWRTGRQLRAAGVPCSCPRCTGAQQAVAS